MFHLLKQSGPKLKLSQFSFAGFLKKKMHRNLTVIVDHYQSKTSVAYSCYQLLRPKDKLNAPETGCCSTRASLWFSMYSLYWHIEDIVRCIRLGWVEFAANMQTQITHQWRGAIRFQRLLIGNVWAPVQIWVRATCWLEASMLSTSVNEVAQRSRHDQNTWHPIRAFDFSFFSVVFPVIPSLHCKSFPSPRAILESPLACVTFRNSSVLI